MDVSSILEKISDVSVTVLGDVMLDRYLTGKVDRISPEAPIPVLLHHNTESRLGGAANVALNLINLTSKVQLVSLVGQDNEGDELVHLLKRRGVSSEGIARSDQRGTTCKTRVMAGWQHLLRLDREQTHGLTLEEKRTIRSKVSKVLTNNKPQAIILQDYNKGLFSEELIAEVISLSKEQGVKIFVDPKVKNFWSYKGVYVFKPNLAETKAQLPFDLKIEDKSLFRAAKYIHERLNCDYVMITLGAEGIYVFSDEEEALWVKAPRVEVADVCGAGDTVVSTLTLALTAGVSLHEAVLFATSCASFVCKIPGVVPIDKEFILREMLS